MLRSTSLIAGLCAGLFASPWLQDPVKPTPAPATPPPAAEAPAPPPAKAPPGKPFRHPTEGVYELRARIMNGKRDELPSRGFLAITGRHLFLTVAAPGRDPDLPLVRSSVRTWTPQNDKAATTIQLGWFTDQDGTLHVEPPGTVEVRSIELTQGGVRVKQDDRNWLEFERVE